MLFDGILETTGTTGTGDLTTAAVAGRPRFTDFFAAGADAGADPFYYAITTQDAVPQFLEIGIGWASAMGTIKRAKVIATYGAGTYSHAPATPADLPAGTKNVVCAAEAASWSPGIAALPALPGAYSRRAMGPTHFAGSAVSVSLVKDRLYLVPILVETPGRIVGLRACLDNVVGAGGTRGVRIGLYAPLASGAPGRLLAASGDLPAPAYAELVASFSPLRLAPGWYYGALAHDYATTAPKAYGGTAVSRQTHLGWSTGAGPNRVAAVYQTLASGWLALPAQAADVAALTIITTAGAPAILLDVE